MTVDAAALGLHDDPLHHLGDVVDVEAGAVEGTVRRHGAEHLADRLQATLARGFRGLDDERRGAHPDDHAVPAPVERGGGVLDRVVGRRCSGGQEARGDPGQQVVGGDVVSTDDDDPPAAAGPDPVLGERQRLGGAGAGGVDLRVGAAGADDLRELRVPHGQAAEQEPPVEGERLDLEQVSQLGDAAVHLGDGRLVAAHPGAHRLEGEQLVAASAIGVVPPEVVGEGVVARGRPRRR